MFRKRKLVKAVALFFSLQIIFDAVFPTLSYALTSGPTAPEYTSFEPVDTTDMVNLLTGDFVYNMPLLEIPGPSGGYPLSLSYHAGIKNEQEASWVGLGWTLNPGAINRGVNGFPDDALNDVKKITDYSDGGERTTDTYNLSLFHKVPLSETSPFSAKGKVNMGFSVSDDTYNGTSRGYDISVGAGIGYSKKEGINKGQQISSVSLVSSIGVKGSSNNGSISSNPYFNQNVGFSSAQMGAQMGATISSKGIKSYARSPGGGVAHSNAAGGQMQSYTVTTNIGTIPLGNFGFFDMKRYYTRYWSDETGYLNYTGVLHANEANLQIESDGYTQLSNGFEQFESYSFDIYNMYDPNSTDNFDENNPVKQLGGTFLNYDNFQVLGQGIGGIIEPYIAENGDLYGQSQYHQMPVIGQVLTEDPQVRYKSLNEKFTVGKVDFRFANDFSNHVAVNASTISENPDFFFTESHEIAPAIDEGIIFDNEKQQIAGSQHIEWYTNEEILQGGAKANGFIDYYERPNLRKINYKTYDDYLQPEIALPYSFNHKEEEVSHQHMGSFVEDIYCENDIYEKCRLKPLYHNLKPKYYSLKDKIGGFKITNSSGVTYHYGLPVYAYGEYSRTKLKNTRKNIPAHRETRNPAPYAYTWLLTAVTGPDYVDRSNSGKSNGILDDADWGYWVKFDYGMWTDSYQWRTPIAGYQHDLDTDMMTFSYGMKELYYLDAVETKSHIALFQKSKRKDGRGVTSRLEGGSKPRSYTVEYRGNSCRDDQYDEGYEDHQLGYLSYNVSPVATMKLDAIYLLQKDNYKRLNISKKAGSKYQEATIDDPHKYYYKGKEIEVYGDENIVPDVDFVEVKYHNGQLVLDNDDVKDILNTSNGLISSSLKVIDFNMDYSLAGHTPNSIGYLEDIYFTPSNKNLESCLEEAVDPEYEIPSNFIDCFVVGWGPCGSGDEINLKEDIFNFYGKDDMFHLRECKGCDFVYREENGSHTNTTYFMKSAGNDLEYPGAGKLTLLSVDLKGKSGGSLIPPVTFSYAKDPMYHMQKYDDWGYYKSDYPSNASYNPGVISSFRNEEGVMVLNVENPSEAEKAVIPYSRRITASSAKDVDAWSLTKISNPLGADIVINYEADTYNHSVYNIDEIFEVEKIDPIGMNRVKIFFKEKNLNFLDYFRNGDPLDLKALFVRKNLNNAPKLYTEQYESSNNAIIKDIKDYLEVENEDLYNLAQSSIFISAVTVASPPSKRIRYGGGLRVNNIKILDEFANNSQSVHYDYSGKGRNASNATSGVTSFKPYQQINVKYPIHNDFLYDILKGTEVELLKELDNAKVEFQRKINSYNEQVMAFVREAPAPGVLYEYVTVSSKMNDIIGPHKEVYHFRVFNEQMVQTEKFDSEITEGNPRRRMRGLAKQLNLENFTSSVGQLIEKTTYDLRRNPLQSVTNNYLYDGNRTFNEQKILATKQGVIEQSSHKAIEQKKYYFKKYDYPWIVEVVDHDRKAIVSHRADYTDVLTGTVVKDYKTGVTTTSANLAFDFFSGSVAKTLNQDSYGNHYLNESVPAYHKYARMGLGMNGGKNMLTQEAAGYTYKIKDTETLKKEGVVSAAIQTWSDKVAVIESEQQLNIWRKHKSYQWNGSKELLADGTYPVKDFEEHAFDFSSEAENNSWEKQSEITLYDVYSHALEAKDINGNYAATRMDPSQHHVIATASNASYNELAYAGAEYMSANSDLEGGVGRGEGNRSTARSHTGDFSLQVAFNSEGFNFNLADNETKLNKKFSASVWVYLPGESETSEEMAKVQLYYRAGAKEIAISPQLNKNKSKSWYLLSLDIDPEGASDVYIGCRNNSSRSVYFDDFRVHPAVAQMTSYVYDHFSGELNYILDGNNIYTKYEYDAMGRLIRTSREMRNFKYGEGSDSYKADHITGEIIYNYGKNSPDESN